jgi:hypothetical protein
VRVDPVITSLQARLRELASLASNDPAVDDAVELLVDALRPAVTAALNELAEQVAVEVGAQLDDHVVEVLLVGGDPTLRVAERRSAIADAAPPSDEEFDARITVRLPPSLKQVVEQAASKHGASVNGWVVDVLDKRAKQSGAKGTKHVTESFDL